MTISHSLSISQTQSPIATNSLQNRVHSTHGAKESSENKTKINNDEEQSHTTVSTQKVETQLSQQELTQLRELRTRDREVRAHEQAHASAAGSLARGGPSYQYQKGPDGQLYAVGGEVSIDTSAVSGDPQATAEKAQKIRRAALAPAQPSPQDRAVAAAATALEASARAELAQQSQETDTEQTSSSAQEEETPNRVTEHSIETPITCAECGGRHSSDSHSAAVLLGESYTQHTHDNLNEKIIDLVG